MAALVDKETWDEGRISEIENNLLQGIFGCRSTEAVEAAITYASFLSTVGITPDNYPVYLRMLEIENHWVIDALIGQRDPFLLLSAVQPNEYIVSRILAMMTRWHKGGIYHKNLSVILGVLQSVYSSPRDGYRIYQVTIQDTNALGKHLDKERGQDDPLNRAILEVLEKISELEDPSNPEMEEIAIHAAAIRNAFFDDKKNMEDVIPPVLLVTIEDRKEVAPREQSGSKAAAKEPATTEG
jgi:IS1 family transposase